jgi:hypothetical protein
MVLTLLGFIAATTLLIEAPNPDSSLITPSRDSRAGEV